jgi:acetolactate synthase-1/3 small subunit
MRHIIGILLQNESGALNRVAGLFTNRGFNIESLSVSATDDPTVSRITLVTKGSDDVVHQIVSQLNKLIDVVNVDDMTRGAHVERELALVKLRVQAGQKSALDAFLQATGSKVLDAEGDLITAEMTGNESEVTAFIADVTAKAELVEVVRSGALALARDGRTLRDVP